MGGREKTKGGLTVGPGGKINPQPEFPTYPKELVGGGIVRYGLKTIAEIFDPVDPDIYSDPEANFERDYELVKIGSKPLEEQIEYWQRKAREALRNHLEARDTLPIIIAAVLRLERGDGRELYRITDNNDEKIRDGVRDLLARLA